MLCFTPVISLSSFSASQAEMVPLLGTVWKYWVEDLLVVPETSEHYWCEWRAEKLTILQCSESPEQERLVLPKTSKYRPLRNPAKLNLFEQNSTRASFPPPACFSHLIFISFPSLFYTPLCPLQHLFFSAPSFSHIKLLAILIECQEVLFISAVMWLWLFPLPPTWNTPFIRL